MSILTGHLQARSQSLGDTYEQLQSGLYVPPGHPQAPPPRCPVGVELFAGAGGFGLGMHMAGWHVAAAVEHWDVAAMTYVVNLGGPDTVMHIDRECLTGKRRKRAPKSLPEAIEAGPPNPPGRDRHFTVTAREWLGEQGGQPVAGAGWISNRGRDGDDGPAIDEPAVEHFWLADVRDLHGAEILDAIGLRQGDVGCVFGGPPCQGFSMAGRRDEMDPRNSLVFDMARLVIEMQPMTMVMENVPGMVNMHTAEGTPVLDALAMMLADGGMGTYEALRRTLAKSSGVGAVVRGRPRDDSHDRCGLTANLDEQQDLFDMLSVDN